MERWERRRKQILDDLKQTTEYCRLKEAALEQTQNEWTKHRVNLTDSLLRRAQTITEQLLVALTVF
jgi:transcription elongation GreA/GreB family factor